MTKKKEMEGGPDKRPSFEGQDNSVEKRGQRNLGRKGVAKVETGGCWNSSPVNASQILRGSNHEQRRKNVMRGIHQAGPSKPCKRK